AGIRAARPGRHAGAHRQDRGYRSSEDRAGRIFRPVDRHRHTGGRRDSRRAPCYLRSGRRQYLCQFLARRRGGLTMNKTWNNKAWFMVLPMLVLVAFSAVIPLMTVVNYSVQDTFGNNA